MHSWEIYVHIPFCVRKCDYCDFLSFPCEDTRRREYLAALIQEITHVKIPETYGGVKSIYVGGGTPSLLSGEEMQRILNTIRSCFPVEEGAEISMEANPGTLTEEKLKGYRAAGVNRLSIGCQSVHDKELRMLGRIHQFADFTESFALARRTGFCNINVDLMSAIPGQHREDWQDCLKTIAALEPEHISAYSLIVEEGTPFAKRRLELPDEEEERQMYADTRKILKAFGYEQYEISNYARPGYACRHNIGYWDGTPYRSFGLGASSYIEETRFRNTGQMDIYLKQAQEPERLRREIEVLTKENRMEEYMFLGLRMNCGVSRKGFLERFGKSMEEVYGSKIEHFVREKLLTFSEDRVSLTEKGMDLANYVMAGFLL